MQEPDRPPLTPSLEANVRSAFAVPAYAEGLWGERLLSALEDIAPNDSQALTDALNDAGFKQPNDESAAVLDWVDATFARGLLFFELRVARLTRLHPQLLGVGGP